MQIEAGQINILITTAWKIKGRDQDQEQNMAQIFCC